MSRIPGLPPRPLFTTQFSRFREDNGIYIDRTAILYKLLTSHEYIYLRRPDGFGKTLFCDTVKVLYTQGKKAFKGLEIEKLWHGPKYEVVHVDFSDAIGFSDVEHFDYLVGRAFLRAFNPTGNDWDYSDASWRLHSLLSKRTDPIVLIMENMAIPLRLHMKEKRLQKKLREIMCSYIGLMMSHRDNFAQVIMTEASDVFSSAVDLKQWGFEDVSELSRYSGIMGFTVDDLKKQYKYWIDRNARNLGMTPAQTVEWLRAHCGGWRFGKRSREYLKPSWVMLFFDEPHALYKEVTEHERKKAEKQNGQTLP